MIQKTYRSTNIIPAAKIGRVEVQRTISLSHDERHIRRKLLYFENGDTIMLDLQKAVQLTEGDILATDSGEHFRVSAALERLYEIKGKDTLHLLELAWHLGNRHLAVEIFPDRILLLYDHIIGNMLETLGATLQEIKAPFQPLHGAYHEHFPIRP
ncbi:MAG: urease accessory protein [Candidatus Tokpelaia sp. JSC188]|nr:MAG: urease accessory protein [Candidatus Tokpelaia sp. JSC188]